MKKSFFYILAAGLICLTACGKQSASLQNEPSSKSFFAMDTYMTITAYGENAASALEQAEERVTELEKMWSVTDENSEIYAINHSSGASVSISKETAELLDYSLRISDLTNGALDCTMYSILTAWGFTTNNYQIPTETELSALLKNTGYERYFVGEDGETYWHILNPETGKPAHSVLISVTIVGKEGRLCDALSTSLFVMGLDKAETFWQEREGFEMVLVTDDGKIYLTEGLEDQFTLNEIYSNLQVEVIHR